jgi:hypothetical protein
MRLAVIIVHFGGLPEWFPLWLKSANNNLGVDFHLFTEVDPRCTGNVVWHQLSLECFNQLEVVEAQQLKLLKPYKLCDFRPAFGKIFAAELRSYDYWGWGDLDVVYGDVVGCLSGSFGKYDYIATGWDGASGPLAFLRNCPEVTELFKNIPNYREKMNDQKSHALDEIDFLEALKLNASCDIVFRECVLDLPAKVCAGKIISLTGRHYVLYHFGGRHSYLRGGIVGNLTKLLKCLGADRGIHIRSSGHVRPGKGRWHCLMIKVMRRISRRFFLGI